MTQPLQHIVYVDDEPDIREIVHMALSLEERWTVRCCESGLHALDLLQNEPIDLVLLDAMMPGLDGPATLERMRADKRLAHIPVIFVTAKAMPQEVVRFIKMGAAGVIAKPFDPMRLAEEVTALWQRLSRQPPERAIVAL